MSVHELRHERPNGWFSKFWGLSESISFLSSPSPSHSFNCPIFCVVFDSRSSFLAPKPHRNTGYAGYYQRGLPLIWHSVSMCSDHNGSKWVGGMMGTQSENSKVKIGSHYSKPSANCSIIMFDVFHWLIRELVKKHDHGDGNGKTAIGLDWRNNNHAFLYIS